MLGVNSTFRGVEGRGDLTPEQGQQASPTPWCKSQCEY